MSLTVLEAQHPTMPDPWPYNTVRVELWLTVAEFVGWTQAQLHAFVSAASECAVRIESLCKGQIQDQQADKQDYQKDQQDYQEDEEEDEEQNDAFSRQLVAMFGDNDIRVYRTHADVCPTAQDCLFAVMAGRAPPKPDFRTIHYGEDFAKRWGRSDCSAHDVSELVMVSADLMLSSSFEVANLRKLLLNILHGHSFFKNSYVYTIEFAIRCAARVLAKLFSDEDLYHAVVDPYVQMDTPTAIRNFKASARQALDQGCCMDTIKRLAVEHLGTRTAVPGIQPTLGLEYRNDYHRDLDDVLVMKQDK